MNSRVAAAKVIESVLMEGRTLTEALAKEERNNKEQQGFIQALCYGVIRNYYYYQAISKKLLKKEFKQKESDLFSLLLLGLYQLDDPKTPDHAAIYETVAAVKKIKKNWAANLLNGVLRRYSREREQLQDQVSESEEVKYNHPQWLINQLKEAYPEKWQQILEINNQHPPMTLRVNQQKISTEDYLQLLNAKHIQGQLVSGQAQAIILQKPVPVVEVPKFFDGFVSVQDLAAQYAAAIVDPKPGQRILDACAAPGGKTSHLLERCPGAEVTAVDNNPKRLEKLKETLARTGCTATVLLGDGTEPQGWASQGYDWVIIDAPCSGVGVIRRHPDIKLLREAEDILELVKTQDALLTALWPLVKEGGSLLYITCSILPEENQQQISKFLEGHRDARVRELSLGGAAAHPGVQLLATDEADGFYYACLSKST